MSELQHELCTLNKLSIELSYQGFNVRTVGLVIEVIEWLQGAIQTREFQGISHVGDFGGGFGN
jgi:hypothetical protein